MKHEGGFASSQTSRAIPSSPPPRARHGRKGTEGVKEHRILYVELVWSSAMWQEAGHAGVRSWFISVSPEHESSYEPTTYRAAAYR